MKIALAGLTLVFCVLAPGLAQAQATNLVCNKCVQAGDLAGAAVTGAKLAPISVKTAKMPNAAVTNRNLTNNAVNNTKLANNAINASKIADGVVTAAKIGPNAARSTKFANASVTAAKLAGGAVNRFKLADGAVAAAKLNLGQYIVLGAAGPTDADNCTALRDALEGIKDNGADRPYAIFLGPGVYDCQANQIAMKEFVTLIGSGAGRSLVKGAYAGGQGDGLIQMASNSEIRSLSVENQGQIGVAVAGVTEAQVTDAAISASNGASQAQGVSVILDGNIVVADSFVSATSSDSASGVFVLGSFAEASFADLINVTAEGRGNIFLARGLDVSAFAQARARDSLLRGDEAGLRTFSIYPAFVASSRVEDGVVGKAAICVGAYDENFAPLLADCTTPP